MEWNWISKQLNETKNYGVDIQWSLMELNGIEWNQINGKFNEIKCGSMKWKKMNEIETERMKLHEIELTWMTTYKTIWKLLNFMNINENPFSWKRNNGIEWKWMESNENNCNRMNFNEIRRKLKTYMKIGM